MALNATVEGELSVAKFLVNYFKRGPFSDPVAVHPLPQMYFKVPVPLLIVIASGANSYSPQLTLKFTRTSVDDIHLLSITAWRNTPRDGTQPRYFRFTIISILRDHSFIFPNI
jgi:hypothetical protein